MYDGKDKSAWYMLVAEKGMVLTKNKIRYLKDTGELQRRTAEPLPPAHIPYISWAYARASTPEGTPSPSYEKNG